MTDIPDNIIPAHTKEGRTGRGRSKQIPIETLIKLHTKKLSHSQIGKITGCTASNITQRLNRAGITTLRDFSTFKDQIYEHLQQRIVSTITDDDIKKAPFGSRVLALAQIEDKIRLIRGLSTANHSIHSMIIEQACTHKDKVEHKGSKDKEQSAPIIDD